MPTPLSELTLDSDLYAPSEAEVAFFKSQTGIESNEELKEHVVAVQKEVWDVKNYLCIRAFRFMKLEISLHPKYTEFVKLRDERPGAIYLELACFFGTDVRKAIEDGYPMENVVANDLELVFWNLGHKLFKSTPETFPVPFIQADVLDPVHIVPRSPFYSPPDTPRPNLKELTTLTPLQGHVSTIHLGLFFHLFDEETQLRAARAIASLLSPEPGSMIFGHHAALPTAGLSTFETAEGKTFFCHSPESWRALWDGMVFEKGTVDVWAIIFELKSEDDMKIMGDNETHIMVWSVTRV